jgi:hypothetical protein
MAWLAAPAKTKWSSAYWTKISIKIRPPQQRLAAGLIVLSMLAAAGIFFTLLRENSNSARGFPLELDVEARGKGLNIRWNPRSAPISQAREGRLVIREDNHRQTIIQLDPQELTTGHLYFPSPAERLQFGLEIVDKAGKVSRESVVTLSPKPAVVPSTPR